MKNKLKKKSIAIVYQGKETSGVEKRKKDKLSFTKFSKTCPSHSLIRRPNKYGCSLTGKACNEFNCPKRREDMEYKKRKKHPFRVARRFRRALG